jgi:hypothetical protein
MRFRGRAPRSIVQQFGRELVDALQEMISMSFARLRMATRRFRRVSGGDDSGAAALA